ncbi:glycosyltransferase family 4 protein [Acidisoma sp. S159]|uniref:glycosyltransferase family 4 protein n=1 Tax=Acidisoma sp. S159 TaxID=1747225 RepID=UPI00131E34D6|nr:glycosyltransferase family 4 protein [Acidisoma sp. S159]
MNPIATPAILFEPDGYLASGPKLMGRQVAGHGFLRAAIANRQGATMSAYTPSQASAQSFNELVREYDSVAKTQWLRPDRPDLLSQIGTLYLPDPRLEAAARLRLRAHPAAYSLCGIIHGTVAHAATDAITGLLTAPVMPWDALISTSSAVAESVKGLIDAEIAYLKWRFGASFSATLPEFPVIPLGVHSADYVITPQERASARSELRLPEDQVVALFVGRLSSHAKAHPHAMCAGLQAAARRSGKKIVLIQCGWFPNESVERGFRELSLSACPDVRVLFSDGRKPLELWRSWSAADLFISLSDNIQESFGLTPIEAMAAGLPAVVSDWNGYKDTIRDGVDGFRIPTWMPQTALGDILAQRYEAGTGSYDYYCGLASHTVSMDMQVLVERLSELVTNVSLRRQMGQAGHRRVLELFDWQVIYRKYQELWTDLGRLRLGARQDSLQSMRIAQAPKASSARMNPFRSFAHYPTALIRASTRVNLEPGASKTVYLAMARQPLFSYADLVLPPAAFVENLISSLEEEELVVQELADLMKIDIDSVLIAVSVLAKMGLIRLR